MNENRLERSHEEKKIKQLNGHSLSLEVETVRM